jgi:uncharacterized protein
MKLSGKTALITGAAGGIGSVIAVELANRGVSLVLVDHNKDKLLKLFDSLENSDKHKYFVVDLSQPKEIFILAKRVQKEIGRLDILINSVGAGVYKGIEELELEEWNMVLNLDLTAVFLTTKELLPLLKKSSESVIVNMGSKCGVKPIAGRLDYCTAKFGLRGFTLTLAEELKETNTRVHHITLGSTLTEFGPLTITQKEELEGDGKKYFTPDFVSKTIVDLIEEGSKTPEIVLEPEELLE